jgi:hypothetical protein
LAGAEVILARLILYVLLTSCHPLPVPPVAVLYVPPCLQPVFFILHLAFFALHYLFASQTAHIGALYAAFLAMMLASGAVYAYCC